MSLDKVKNIILVLSGKGGVGKSSITTQLALSLSLAGKTVGVLDIDLTGPSIPRFLGIEDEKVKQAPGGWLPVLVHESQTLPARPRVQSEENHDNEDDADIIQSGTETETIGSLHAMSLAFLLASRSTAIVWRGPKKTAMCKQFLTEVLWHELDYLLIDTPPGTSDEHISVVETLLKTVSVSVKSSNTTPSHSQAQTGPSLAGAVLVTTPQAVSTADVRKEINFCAKTGVPIIGVVENMSGYVCPCCGVSTNLFSKGGGQVMAEEFGVPFLGGVPVDALWGRLIEEGVRPVYAEVAAAKVQDDQPDEVEDVVERLAIDGKSKHADEALVDKYRDCSLYPVFKDVARRVIQTTEEGTAVLVAPNAAAK